MLLGLRLENTLHYKCVIEHFGWNNRCHVWAVMPVFADTCAPGSLTSFSNGFEVKTGRKNSTNNATVAKWLALSNCTRLPDFVFRPERRSLRPDPMLDVLQQHSCIEWRLTNQRKVGNSDPDRRLNCELIGISSESSASFTTFMQPKAGKLQRRSYIFKTIKD